MSNSSTLRIVPHPDENMRTFKSKQVVNAAGQVTRKAGTIMYRYLVQGSPEEMARYKVARGKYYLEDTNPTITLPNGDEVDNPYFGSVIYNSQESITGARKLVFTRDGRVAMAEDPFIMGLLAKQNQTKQFRDGVQREIDKLIAQTLFAGMQNQAITPQVLTSEPQAQPEDVFRPLDEA